MGYGKKIITILMNKAYCAIVSLNNSLLKSFKYKKIGEHINNEIIRFVNDDLQLDVTVSPDNETVWLNRNQIAQLFGRDIKTIGKHINNALKEELSNEVVVAKCATTSQHGAIDGKQIISDSALVAITLMIAESRPEEKETMVKLVMNFLKA